MNEEQKWAAQGQGLKIEECVNEEQESAQGQKQECMNEEQESAQGQWLKVVGCVNEEQESAKGQKQECMNNEQESAQGQSECQRLNVEVEQQTKVVYESAQNRSESQNGSKVAVPRILGDDARQEEVDSKEGKKENAVYEKCQTQEEGLKCMTKNWVENHLRYEVEGYLICLCNIESSKPQWLECHDKLELRGLHNGYTDRKWQSANVVKGWYNRATVR